MLTQSGTRCRHQRRGPLAHTPRQLCEQVLSQGNDVFWPRAQRRDVQLDGVQAIIEIGPEPSVGRQRGKISVARRYDARLGDRLSRIAELAIGTVFQQPKELALQGQWQSRHLVEEKRTRSCLFHQSDMRAFGRGHRSTCVAEHFALGAVDRNRRATDNNKGKLPPHRRIMELARCDFLADTGFAQEKHWCRRILHALEFGFDATHRVRRPDRRSTAHVVAGGDFSRAEGRDLVKQCLYLEGLGHIIVSTGAHQTHSLLHLAERRNENYRRRSKIGKGPPKQLLTIHIWKPNVADQNLACCFAQMCHGLFTRVPPAHAVTLKFKALHQRLSHDRIVLDHADHGRKPGVRTVGLRCGGGAHVTASCPVPSLTGKVTMMRDPCSLNPIVTTMRPPNPRTRSRTTRMPRPRGGSCGSVTSVSVNAAATAFGRPGPPSTTCKTRFVRPT